MTARALQYTETRERAGEDARVFAALSHQEGYLGGRVLPPCPSRSGWLVQTFHDAGDLGGGDPLPEGARLVVIPEGLRRQLRIPGRSV